MSNDLDLGWDTSSPAAPSGPPSGADVGLPVIVVEADGSARSRLTMQLGPSVVALEHVDDLPSHVPPGPMVLVLGPSCADEEGMLGAEQVVSARPEVGAILVARDPSTELFKRSIRSGIRDVLAFPADPGQLNEAVRRVAVSLGSISRSIAGGPSGDGGEPGRVITVFSTKGGAGKSVVASNLAVALALRAEEPVVLVDADLQFGDIAVMLKLAPRHTIADARGDIDRLDLGFLQSLLVTHPDSGLLVLAAPLEPAVADQITTEHIHKIVELLRSYCAFVVVDTPAYFNEVVLGLIEQSDDVLLIAGLDIPNIKNVKIGLQTMRLLDTPLSKIHLILNRSNSKVKLDVAQVEELLQMSADFQIPSDIVVPQSVNRGAPVILSAPRSAVAKSLGQLADKYLPVGSGKKRRR